MAKTQASQTVAVTAEASDINHYRFLGVAGAVTVTGIFVDVFGKQTGPGFTTTVAAVTGTAVRVATSIPSDAVGAIINSTGDMYYGLYADGAAIATGTTSYTSDFETNYARYPRLVAGYNLPLGAVAVV